MEPFALGRTCGKMLKSTFRPFPQSGDRKDPLELPHLQSFSKVLRRRTGRRRIRAGHVVVRRIATPSCRAFSDEVRCSAFVVSAYVVVISHEGCLPAASVIGTFESGFYQLRELGYLSSSR